MSPASGRTGRPAAGGLLFPGDVVPAFPKFSGYPAFVLSRHPTYEDAGRFHQWLDATITMRYAATV